MSRQISDDDLLDHWLIYGPGGAIEVTEETAMEILRHIEEETVTVQDDEQGEVRDAFIIPYIHHFFDLFGTPVYLRLDQAYMVTHTSPETRANATRLEALLKKEEPFE